MGRKVALLSIVAVAGAALAAPANAACQLIKIAELPVTMQDMRPMITAKINGVDVQFFIDSGAFFSSLTTASATKLDLSLAPPPFGLTYIRGAGRGDAEISTTTVKDFTLAGQLLHRVDFIVLDKGGGSGEVGVIGQNILAGADVEYDLGDGVIRLMRPQGCGYEPLAYWATSQPYSEISIDPIDRRDAHTRGSVSVNGQSVRATFDTGSPRSLLSTAAAARAGVKSTSPGVVAADVTSGIAQRSYFQTWRGRFASFKIGGEEITNFELLFGDIALYDNTDMLIGVDFFLSHRILVSNSQHRLYFTYNGGPVFNLDRPLPPAEAKSDAAPASPPSANAQPGAPAADSSDAPQTADDFARRAAAFMATRDYEKAIADLSQAVNLAPNEPRYPYERARGAREPPAAARHDRSRPGG